MNLTRLFVLIVVILTLVVVLPGLGVGVIAELLTALLD